MQVRIDRNRCRRCGLCVAICPEIFQIDRDRGARVKHLEVPPIDDLQESCVFAAEDCPMCVIDIIPPPPAQPPQTPSEEPVEEPAQEHLVLAQPVGRAT